MIEQTGWRAFVGEWFDYHGAAVDRDVIDRRDVTWSTARDALIGFARDNEGDGCADCLAAANRCIRELEALTVGAQWSGEIDRDELWLIREEAP